MKPLAIGLTGLLLLIPTRPASPEGPMLSISIGPSGVYLEGGDPVAPQITMDSEEPVDVYVGFVLGGFSLFYNPCADPASAWSTSPEPCTASHFDLTLFTVSAGDLAALFPGELLVPFGFFVRLTEPGTGAWGPVLLERSVRTYVANLPPPPPLPAPPW